MKVREGYGRLGKAMESYGRLRKVMESSIFLLTSFAFCRLLSLSLAFFCLLSHSFAADSAGTTVMNFLRMDTAARQTGMGGVGVGLFLDAQNMAYNPALLGMLRHNEIGLTHSEWLAGVKFQDLSSAIATKSMGTFGIHFKNLGYGSIESFDAKGEAMNSFTARDTLFAAGWGREFGSVPGLFAGAAVKYAREDLSFVSASGISGDLGIAFVPFKESLSGGLSFGAAVKHVGSKITFDSAGEALPTTVDFGVGWKGLLERLAVGADAHMPKGQARYYSAGAEYWASEALALRAGFETHQNQGLGFRLGGGVRFGDWQLDYAWLPFGIIGNTHHIGLLYKFGGPAESAYRAGLKLMRKAKYAEAILDFHRALELDPKMDKAAIRLKQAHGKMQELKELP